MAHAEQVYRQVGRRLKEARERAGLTQEEVGKYLGMTKVAYGRYERADRRILIAELHKVATLVGQPIWWFFGDEVSLEQATSWHYQQLTVEDKEFLRDMVELMAERRRKAESAA